MRGALRTMSVRTVIGSSADPCSGCGWIWGGRGSRVWMSDVISSTRQGCVGVSHRLGAVCLLGFVVFVGIFHRPLSYCLYFLYF